MTVLAMWYSSADIFSRTPRSLVPCTEDLKVFEQQELIISNLFDRQYSQEFASFIPQEQLMLFPASPSSRFHSLAPSQACIEF